MSSLLSPTLPRAWPAGARGGQANAGGAAAAAAVRRRRGRCGRRRRGAGRPSPVGGTLVAPWPPRSPRRRHSRRQPSPAAACASQPARARRWAADPRVDTARQHHRRAAGRRAAAARSLQAPGVLRSGGGTHLSSRGLCRRAPGGGWGCRAAASGAAFYAAELAEASQGSPGAGGACSCSSCAGGRRRRLRERPPVPTWSPATCDALSRERQQRLPARHAVFTADGVGRRPCSAATSAAGWCSPVISAWCKVPAAATANAIRSSLPVLDYQATGCRARRGAPAAGEVRARPGSLTQQHGAPRFWVGGCSA